MRVENERGDLDILVWDTEIIVQGGAWSSLTHPQHRFSRCRFSCPDVCEMAKEIEFRIYGDGTPHTAMPKDCLLPGVVLDRLREYATDADADATLDTATWIVMG